MTKRKEYAMEYMMHLNVASNVKQASNHCHLKKMFLFKPGLPQRSKRLKTVGILVIWPHIEF